MGNSNCCETKNIDLEKSKTLYPFSENANFSNKPPRKSQSFSSLKKEKSIGNNEDSLKSIDSKLINKLYDEIEENCLKNNFQKTLNFGRTDIQDFFLNFNTFKTLYLQNYDETLSSLVDAPKVEHQIVSLLNFYRVKLQNVFKSSQYNFTFVNGFIASNGVLYASNNEQEVITGKGLIIPCKKSFYEGDIVKNLPHGLGVFFYSWTIVYYGSFQNGLRSGKGFLEICSKRVFN